MAESQSERLFQALVRFIDHMETSERTLEWIEEQAREGDALRGLTEEATEEYLNDVRARIAVRVDRDASSRRGIAHRVQVVMEIASTQEVSARPASSLPLRSATSLASSRSSP